MPKKNNKQLNYWLNNFKYVERNNKFDNLLGKKVWHNLLKNKKIYNVLECGSNIGRNLKQINLAYPNKKLSFIELNTEAFQICKLNKNIENLIILKKSIFQSSFAKDADLLNTLKPLLSGETLWKPHALLLMGDYYLGNKEKQKAKEFYNEIMLYNNELPNEYYYYPLFYEYNENLNTVILLYENDMHFKLVGNFQGGNMITLFTKETLPIEILKLINYLR